MLIQKLKSAYKLDEAYKKALFKIHNFIDTVIFIPWIHTILNLFHQVLGALILLPDNLFYFLHDISFRLLPPSPLFCLL